jgi:hypothetical protein
MQGQKSVRKKEKNSNDFGEFIVPAFQEHHALHWKVIDHQGSPNQLSHVPVFPKTNKPKGALGTTLNFHVNFTSCFVPPWYVFVWAVALIQNVARHLCKCSSTET